MTKTGVSQGFRKEFAGLEGSAEGVAHRVLKGSPVNDQAGLSSSHGVNGAPRKTAQ
jgi:hypothetical protein